MIERGYERRNRHLWSSTRWQTYYLMKVQCGDESLNKAMIYSPKDLLHLPWDVADTEDDSSPIPSDAEVERLRQLMREENAKLEQKESEQ